MDMATNERATALPSSMQVGVVVRDVDETIKLLSSLWGLGPWDIKELSYTKDNLTVGEPFKIKVAYADLGAAKLELVQPVEGRSIFSEFLTTRGEGLFNLNFRLPNYDEMMEKAKEYRSRMILGIEKAKRYSYLQTEPGGIVVEFAEE